MTIFGESAGGGSVLVHLTSPLSRGLFQRAIMQSPGIPTPRAKVVGLTELADAEKMAIDYARRSASQGDGGSGAEGAARATGRHAHSRARRAGRSWQRCRSASRSSASPDRSVDGKLIVETPEAAIAAGHQAMVPVIDRRQRPRPGGSAVANSKDELFAIFGPYAAEARKLYDPQGDQTLDELKQQVFADRTMTEPARHLADEVARAGQPVWLYRFSYVAEALRAIRVGRARCTASRFPTRSTFRQRW